jgi:hypothetical protein
MRNPLFQITFNAATLLREHPPQFRHPHKAGLFSIAYPDGIAPSAEIEISRWPLHVDEPIRLEQSLSLDVVPNYFDYVPVENCPSGFEWHVNFADPRLFAAYGSGLFAQDEIQVAEHPLLGSIREALLAQGLPASTADDSGPTPILVRHVERRIAVSTGADPSAGRPFGLYGNRFKSASFDIVRQATRQLNPPSYSNIIAIAALPGGQGVYTKDQIRYTLTTALTAFAAARGESVRAAGPSTRTIIHSGFWGCGAFGGNRHLMTAVQMIAARASKIDRLIFHTGDAAGVAEANRGFDVAEKLMSRCGPPCPLDTVVQEFVALKFRWGFSDGN